MPHVNGALVVAGVAFAFWFRVQPSGTNAIVGGGGYEAQNRHHHTAAGEGGLNLNTNRIRWMNAILESAAADKEKEQLEQRDTSVTQ